MPSSNSRHVFSYQTRVGVTPDEDKALAAYAALFGRVERTLYADLRKGQEAADLKSEYLDRLGITARQFNATRAGLEGKIEASRVSLLRQIEELRIRIRQARKIIAKLAKRIPGSNELHQKRRRLAGLERRLEQREADRKAGRIGLCFGSKKLFRAQFHLEENGFASHQEWKQAWKEARSKQFFVLGSKDENRGCQGCVASRKDDGSYSLRLRLPNTRAEKEKYVVLSGVRFAYGQRQFEDSLASGRALSYRFLRDEKGWRVLVFNRSPSGGTHQRPPAGCRGDRHQPGSTRPGRGGPLRELYGRPACALRHVRQNSRADQGPCWRCGPKGHRRGGSLGQTAGRRATGVFKEKSSTGR